MEEKAVEDDPALTVALKAYSTLSSEQRAVLSKALCEFVNCLSNSNTVITETAWFNRANWSDAEWDSWETWGWYRHFCRRVSIFQTFFFLQSVTDTIFPNLVCTLSERIVHDPWHGRVC